MLSKLKGHDFRITPQRIAVLSILAGSKEHPSVEEIYSVFVQSVRRRNCKNEDSESMAGKPKTDEEIPSLPNECRRTNPCKLYGQRNTIIHSNAVQQLT